MARFKFKIVAAAAFAAVVLVTAAFASNGARTGRVREKTNESGADLAVNSARFAGIYTKSAGNSVEVAPIFNAVAENDELVLYVENSGISICVVNKKTGYVWTNRIDDFGEDKMNSRWQSYVNSGVTVEYVSVNKNGYLETKSSEESFLLSGNSTAEITLINGGFTADVTFGECGIGLTFSVVLDGGSVVVSMDGNSIRETDKAKIVSAQFFPFFGSTRYGAQNGYILLPDEGGALVNFNSVYKNVGKNYAKRYHGDDAAVTVNGALNDLIFPIFGVVHGVGDNGFLTEITEGDYYAELNLYPAGLRTNYYFAFNKYLYRQSYSHIVSGERQSTMFTPERFEFDVSQRYVFLSGDDADYGGMAAFYRDSLIKRGLLKEQGAQSGDVPLALNVVTAATNEGMLWNSDVLMTTFEEAGKIADDLASMGVVNLQMILDGPFQSARTYNESGRYKLRGGLGGKSGLKELREKLEARGGDLSFSYTIGYVMGKVGGIDLKEDVQRKLNRQYNIWDDKWGASSFKWFWPNADGIKKILAADVKAYDGLGVDKLDVWLADPVFSSSYNTKGTITREQAVETVVSALKDAAGSGAVLNIEWSNVPLGALAYMNSATWFPLGTSLYPYVTDTIPFAAMVLRGSADIFSEILNNTGTPEETELRMIEWGVYPKFRVTEKDTSLLMYSDWANLVSCKYDDWRVRIAETYNRVNDALKDVKGLSLVRHETVSPGVSVSAYANGVKVIVNYTDKPYNYSGTEIPPMGYGVVK